MAVPFRLLLPTLGVALLTVLDAPGASPEAAPETTPDARSSSTPGAASSMGRRPWRVGEKLTYEAKINFLKVGTGTMEVLPIETVRDHPTFHTQFRVKGRMLFFSVNDTYESWFDTTTLSSLRYRQEINETSYKARRLFEFYPDRQTFTENDKPEEPSAPDPLDDGSFIYFVRSLPLEVGASYEFNRYFRPDRNPVVLKVLRRERVRVPAGEFDAIVVQPIIKTKGIFSENGKAEIWIADDSTRFMLKMSSGLPFGTLHLALRNVEYVDRP